MLNRLLENSALYLNSSVSVRKRYFYNLIDHNDKLIGIIGAKKKGVRYWK